MSSNGAADTVPGLGFKDKEKALETIKNLEDRDPDYQRLAIKGLIGRAKRTLQVTKAEDKLTNIKEAMRIFEDWLADFEVRKPPTRTYLPLATVELFESSASGDAHSFINAYKSCDGDYKKMRTITSGEDKPTWDIVRNRRLAELLADGKVATRLWNEDGDMPTPEHIEMITWAYSPDASKLKKQLPNIESNLGKEQKKDKEKTATKRKSDGKKDEASQNKRKSAGKDKDNDSS